MRPLAISLVALLLAGCATPEAPGATAPLQDGAPRADAAPIADLRACVALNAFGYVPATAFGGLVPANWTFTTLAPGMAIVRALLVECPEESALLLSTPMFPDEASADKHENPDVVVQVFATDEADAARWALLGVPVHVAVFERAEGPALTAVRVTTPEGLGFRMERLAGGTPGRPYEWRAVYAAGATDVAWMWGDEVSNQTALHRVTMEPGPASVLAGQRIVPVGVSEWREVDLTYRPGLPPAEKEQDAGGARAGGAAGRDGGPRGL